MHLYIGLFDLTPPFRMGVPHILSQEKVSDEILFKASMASPGKKNMTP